MRNLMKDVGAFELEQAISGRDVQGSTGTTTTEHLPTWRKQTRLDRAILVMGAGFGDLDNDGWLDVYLGTGENRDYEGAAAESDVPQRQRAKRFRRRNHLRADLVTFRRVMAVAFGDLGNNGHEDVFEEMGGAFAGRHLHERACTAILAMQTTG